MNLPIQLGKGRDHRMLEPEASANDRSGYGDDQEKDQPKQHAQDRTPAHFLHFHISSERHLENIVSSAIATPQRSAGLANF
jgi:hypothetical protein